MNNSEQVKKTWVTPDLQEISTKKFEGGAASTGAETPTTYHS